jgi:hypothetical protein
MRRKPDIFTDAEIRMGRLARRGHV